LQEHANYMPSGWESLDIPPHPNHPRHVTKAAQAGAARLHADRDVQDDVSPHAGQDVQPWWEESKPKKESDGASKMRERPQEERAGTVGAVEERTDGKSLQTLLKSDKSRVSVDFHSFERRQAIHLQVEEILDGEVLREAEDFADLISPVFRVVLQGASGGKVSDGQTVDLIVELVEVDDNLNTDSLVFIKKSEESESMWCGVSGGTFDLVPSESGKGLLLRGRVTTDSFSLWCVAKCHVKVAAHHIESDGRRKLRFIVYSGAPVGSYPIPRNKDDVRKDPASSRNTLVPMLRGFFMYPHSQMREEVVLRDGLEFTIQVQGTKNGVVKSSSEKSKWWHGRSIDFQKVEIDVHDIDLDSELEVNISRKSMGWLNCSRDGIREFTLKRENRNVLPCEYETCASLVYWCNLDEYTGPQKSITCGYCLSCNEEQSMKVFVKGIGERIKLGDCCKIVENELTGNATISSSVSVVSNVVSSASEGAVIERPVVGGQTSAQLLTCLPCIEGFFCKIQPDKNLLLRTIESLRNADASDKDEKLRELESLLSDTVEAIDPHKEAEKLTMLFQKSNRRREFEVSFHQQPIFTIFSECMRTAAERNVCHLLFCGHGQSQWGFFWLKDVDAKEYEKNPTEKFVRLFTTEVAGAHARGTIEGVVLNACDTEDLGKKLRDAGVPHVVCWRSEVYDSTASKFTSDFYTSFEEIKNYKIVFLHAVSRMDSGGGAARGPRRDLARARVDYVCLLSKDGDEFPDTGHIRG
jgi:hypothetical protein